MPLTEEQQQLNNIRLQEHQHARYEVDIALEPDRALKDVIVYPDVLRPEKTSSLYLARYLYQNQDIYKNKNVLDLGCGCGIQGMVMSIYGAKFVTLSDVSEAAVDNTRENIAKFNLEDKTKIVQGDLFENVADVFDVIVFNHPFFPAEPINAIPITKAIFDPGLLIGRFLEEAPKHSVSGGIMIMPFFHFAGETNNPEIQGKKHGYEVKVLYQVNVNDENIQKGLFSVFQLQKLIN